tara:strand:+ start:1392 stop:1796 length:405 start_codon:yes stop_codon:yes gene_type:complete
MMPMLRNLASLHLFLATNLFSSVSLLFSKRLLRLPQGPDPPTKVDLLVRLNVDLEDLLRKVDLLRKADLEDILRKVDLVDLLRKVDLEDLLRKADLADLLRKVDLVDLLRKANLVDLLVRLFNLLLFRAFVFIL